MQGRFQFGTRWLARGTLVGAAFVVLLVLYSLPTLLEHTALVRTLLTRGSESQLPPLPAAYIVRPILFAFLLGFATSGVWAYFARSRLGLLWAVLAGFALPLFFTFTTLRLSEYLFAMTFMTFDVPSQTVPVAVAQLTGRRPQPLYLMILYALTSLLPGALLWTGLRFSALKRL